MVKLYRSSERSGFLSLEERACKPAECASIAEFGLSGSVGAVGYCLTHSVIVSPRGDDVVEHTNITWTNFIEVVIQITAPVA